MSQLASGHPLRAPLRRLFTLTQHARPPSAPPTRPLRPAGTAGAEASARGGARAEGGRSLYEVLGLQPGASAAEVRSAYRRRARECHPDKGGSAEEFRLVTRAHAVLSDERKRALYDEHGDDALEQIEALTDGGRAGGAQVAEEPVGPVAVRIQVPLELLHTGGKHTFFLSRLRPCTICNGIQSASGVCRACRGRGMQSLDMGSLRFQVACEQCRGTGRLLCRGCAGRGLQQEEAEVSAEIPPGPSGQQVLLRGEGHRLPGRAKGDVVLVVTAEPHPRFALTDASRGDLATELAVPLEAALCGGPVALGPHLDGRKIRVQLDPVVSPGDVFVVPGEGTWAQGGGRGALILQARVAFPKKPLSARQTRALRKALQAWGGEGGAVAGEAGGSGWEEVKAQRVERRAAL